MLQKLREHSSAWFAKLLFLLLVVSFGSWGITDVLRNYSSTRPILTVGGFKVALDEFMHGLRQAQNHVQNLAKGKLTPEKMKQLNLSERVMEEMTVRGLITQEIGIENIVVPDPTLTQALHSMDPFKGDNGKFNPVLFRQLLQHNGISEAKFINDLRLSLMQNQLFQPLVHTQYLPKQYSDFLFRALHQDYVFALVEIPSEKVSSVPTPQEEDLKVFYNSNQSQFSLPETRSITLLFLDMEELKKRTEVPEESIKEAYESRIHDFMTEERREAKELIVSNDKVDKAMELLKAGKPMSAVAQEVKGEARNMGWMSQSDLPEDVGKEVFSGTPPFISEPVTTQFGSRIIQVLNIQPQKTKPYESVRQELLSTLRAQIANDSSGELRNKIEDSLAGGATPADVAKTYELKLVTISSLTAQGRTADNKPSLPANLSQEVSQKLLELAFSTPEGTDTPLTEMGNGNAFILHVDKITPSHTPEFSAIQEAVRKEWYRNKRHEAAYKLAVEIAKAQSMHEFRQFAAKEGLQVQDKEPVNRIKVDKDKGETYRLNSKLWRDMFGLKQNQTTLGPVDSGFVVAMLVKISPCDIRKYGKYEKKLEERLRQEVAADLQSSFLTGLRKIYPISVDAKMLAKVSGQSQ